MARKVDEPAVTIGRTCPLCGKVYALCHPKDVKPFCDGCMQVLREIVNERRQDDER